MQVESLSLRNGHWNAAFPPLDSAETLVLVFGATSFADHAEPLLELQRAYPSSHLAGCSTAGEILGAQVSDESLAVSIVQFERTALQTAQAELGEGGDSFAAGQRLAKELRRPDLKAILLFSDGLSVNGSELVRGMNSELPTDVAVSGGLAGDGDRFEQTWVLTSEGPRSGFVRAVGLYGDKVRVNHGSKGGWHIFGPQREVTKSDKNELFELDGQPALDLYRKYLGEHAAGLPSSALRFPLAVREKVGNEQYVVRTILSIDEEKKSLTFAGNVPEGYSAQLMQANLENLIEGATQAARATLDSLDESTSELLALSISCVGRRLMLGERAEEEVEAILDELPAAARQIGFYSYGEISPYGAGPCDLHNQTMTLTTISED